MQKCVSWKKHERHFHRWLARKYSKCSPNALGPWTGCLSVDDCQYTDTLLDQTQQVPEPAEVALYRSLGDRECRNNFVAVVADQGPREQEPINRSLDDAQDEHCTRSPNAEERTRSNELRYCHVCLGIDHVWHSVRALYDRGSLQNEERQLFLEEVWQQGQ